MNPKLWPYFLRQALSSIVENRTVHLVGIGTMVVSLLIFGSFLLLFTNLNAWIQGLGHTHSISVYLDIDVNERQRTEIEDFIKNMPGASIEKYTSKEEALRDLSKALGPQARLLEGMPKEILPASYDVVFKDIGDSKRDFSGIKKTIEGLKGVEEVQSSEDWFSRFEGVINMVRLAGMIIGGLLCLGVIFIVSNTIKLAIYARREEIEIMKLVGATDWFVKTPFLIEGLLQGIISGILSLLILFIGYLILSAKKMYFFNLALLDFVFIPHDYIILILGMSILLGLAGSFIALGRFFDI
jgi:cell division transport system permease protein